MRLELNLVRRDRTDEAREVTVRHLVIAGWTGRDAVATEAHIRELEAIGVPRPAAVPTFYRAAAGLLTTSPAIQVLGGDSSGEVEPVLVVLGGELWIGLGSDHTDRGAERSGVSLAKQLCAKPVGREFWLFSEVAGHWDEVVLRSWAVHGGERLLYQEGPAAALLRPEDLLARYRTQAAWASGAAMFCGTLPVIGALGHADRFEMRLEDRVLGRSIDAAYDVEVLPVVT
ncbi:MAG: DUF2848 domain-containing protein [Spirochaetaceae bacterium]|nr:DUF2848 domain-containing protein [Spirochaetaceae bacterium]